MPFAYIIRSLKDQKYYIGSAIDLDKRLSEHNRGQTKSTRHRRPFTLIWFEEYSSLKDARREEKSSKLNRTKVATNLRNC